MRGLPVSPQLATISRMRSRPAPCSAIMDSRSSFANARVCGSLHDSTCSMRLAIRSILSFNCGSGCIGSRPTEGSGSKLFQNQPPPLDRYFFTFPSLRSSKSRMCSEYRRVVRLEHLAIAEIHVHATRQARIETADRSHNVDALEFVRAVFLKDRCVLHSIFVGSGSAVNIARVGVPRSRRIGMIVRDFSIANHHVMRQHSADRLVEPASDSLFGNLEI